jgi:hypothetical protein
VFDPYCLNDSAREHDLVIAFCYWHDAFWIYRFSWPLVHRTFGNATASTVGVATRWSSTGKAVQGGTRLGSVWGTERMDRPTYWRSLRAWCGHVHTDPRFDVHRERARGGWLGSTMVGTRRGQRACGV